MKTAKVFLVVLLVAVFICAYVSIIFFLTLIPPGCPPQIFIGGCSARHMIKDFKIVPMISCIDYGIDNCVQPSVGIINKCDSPIIIDGVDIPQSGQMSFIDRHQRRYPPPTDEYHLHNGTYKDIDFTISFVRTKELC